MGSDGITREVHHKVQVYVRDGVVGQFSSDHLTKDGRRTPNIGQIFINGTVEYLGIPDFYRTGEPFWANNILPTSSS